VTDGAMQWMELSSSAQSFPSSAVIISNILACVGPRKVTIMHYSAAATLTYAVIMDMHIYMHAITTAASVCDAMLQPS